jgi:hypothetical protein
LTVFRFVKLAGQVVGRAGGRAKRAHLLDAELLQARRVEQGLGFLVEEGLVGGPAALGDEEKLVGLALVCIEVDLGREVRARVGLLIERERHVL